MGIALATAGLAGGIGAERGFCSGSRFVSGREGIGFCGRGGAGTGLGVREDSIISADRIVYVEDMKDRPFYVPPMTLKHPSEGIGKRLNAPEGHSDGPGRPRYEEEHRS